MPDTAAPLPEAYAALETTFRRLNALQEAEAVLHWDLATIMPHGGSSARAEQLAELKAVCHGMITSRGLKDQLAAARAAQGDLSTWQQANLREMERQVTRASALPEDLVTALSRACSACEAVWRTARAEADFKAVEPYVTEVLNLSRQEAQAKSEVLGLGLYDALLDQYEPGARSAEIDDVFAELEAFLPDFTQEVLDKQAEEPPVSEPEGPFPTGTQKALAETFMTAIGFSFDHGRLDESLHPFCGGTPDDVRITTRYDEGDFTSALMGVLHETGHAMYERGLPADWRNQPVGKALGMAIHESQSLLVEMQVCRSKDFLAYAAPVIREAFNASGPAWEEDNLYRLYTRVKRDFIRVEADEVTYPAHVIIRYRLEKALIEGKMEIPDLPAAWNESYQKLLNITPPDDGIGCLQDIHWYDGAWGYFPTYTLGAMTAAQLFDTAKAENPDIVPAIRQGNFAPLMTWLGAKVHGQGSFLPAREMLTQATGKPLDPSVFERHLKTRYLSPS